MFRKNFIEIVEGWIISRSSVLAVERVLHKETEQSEPKEKTRLTFVNGQKLVVDKHYDVVKKIFL